MNPIRLLLREQFDLCSCCLPYSTFGDEKASNIFCEWKKGSGMNNVVRLLFFLLLQDNIIGTVKQKFWA